jgi:hypothetical protein
MSYDQYFFCDVAGDWMRSVTCDKSRARCVTTSWMRYTFGAGVGGNSRLDDIEQRLQQLESK